MIDSDWQIVPNTNNPVVNRILQDGRTESRLVSSFTPDDPDYAAIMQLVAANELTIAEAS
jgi:hypothetical protein